MPSWLDLKEGGENTRMRIETLEQVHLFLVRRYGIHKERFVLSGEEEKKKSV
jgi:hypothetical protein